MAKEKVKSGENYVQRVHRQHNSLVLTIPKKVCKHLGLVAGDYTILTFIPLAGTVLLEKFEKGELKHGTGNKIKTGKD